MGNEFSRSELLSLLVRTCLASGLSYMAIKWAVTMMDPTSKRKSLHKKQAEELLRRLGLPPSSAKLDEHEVSIACQLVEPQSVDVTWNDIAGLDGAIEELRETVILPIKNRHLFADSRLVQPPKGVLLHGPPGCGKTMLAKATAREAAMHFINLEVSSLTDKWYGESQKLCKAVFSLAVKLSPCIVFIDEIDSFLRSRAAHDHEATAMMKALFMQLWDGLNSDGGSHVVVMGATNRPQDIDRAILRRMPATIHIALPNEQQRKAIVSLIMRGESVEDSVDFNHIAKLTSGFSGSDLREICRLAALFRVRERLNRNLYQSDRRLVGGGTLDHVVVDDCGHQMALPRHLSAIKHSDFERAISKLKENKSYTGGLVFVDDNLE